ncbi:transposase [Streptomyces uncialis]|uniref:transposase n=1 Tax=Streptomyces uncialis TaxID=1048205 RepID=UPI0037F42CE6
MPAAPRRGYPSDTTIAEWALLEPFLPVPACQTKTGDHPEKWPRRMIVDGIRYIVDNGAKWRALPADLPLWHAHSPSAPANRTRWPVEGGRDRAPVRSRGGRYGIRRGLCGAVGPRGAVRTAYPAEDVRR